MTPNQLLAKIATNEVQKLFRDYFLFNKDFSKGCCYNLVPEGVPLPEILGGDKHKPKEFVIEINLEEIVDMELINNKLLLQILAVKEKKNQIFSLRKEPVIIPDDRKENPGYIGYCMGWWS